MTQPQMQAVPTPVNVVYAIADMSDGTKAIVLDLYLVTGVTRIFMPVSGAADMSGKLADLVKQAQGPVLLTPGPRGLIGPDGRPIVFSSNGNSEPHQQEAPAEEAIENEDGEAPNAN